MQLQMDMTKQILMIFNLGRGKTVHLHCVTTELFT